jgi:hypothetical protein
VAGASDPDASCFDLLIAEQLSSSGNSTATEGALRGDRKGTIMRKPLLTIDEPEPKKATRADRPPTEGFATIVDGHFKSEFDTVEAAEAAGRKLKSAYPYLQVEVYDSAMKVRTLLS